MAETRRQWPTGEGPDRRADRELVLDFKTGCPDAYESIYRRHHERVYRTCLRILNNPADAAEATQETFLKAFKGLGRFNGQYHLGAWLAQIANNVALDQLRARRRSVNIVSGTDEVVHLEDEHRGPEAEVADRVGVAETLEELQPLHAEALMLQAVEGLSHRQIAARLSMSASQVKSLLHRSRSSFKKAWDKASGWMLAPFGLIKPVRTKNAPSDSIAAVSPATGVLLERIAASAMAAVVAVAGFATNQDGSSDAPSLRVPSYTQPSEKTPNDLGAPKGRRAETVSAESAEQGPLDGAKSKVAELLQVEKVLENQLDEEPEPSDDGSGGPRVPSGKKPLPSEARKAVKEAKRAVPSGTPDLDSDSGDHSDPL